MIRRLSLRLMHSFRKYENPLLKQATDFYYENAIISAK